MVAVGDALRERRVLFAGGGAARIRRRDHRLRRGRRRRRRDCRSRRRRRRDCRSPLKAVAALSTVQAAAEHGVVVGRGTQAAFWSWEVERRTRRERERRRMGRAAPGRVRRSRAALRGRMTSRKHQHVWAVWRTPGVCFEAVRQTDGFNSDPIRIGQIHRDTCFAYYVLIKN
ncbi:hypothetical protein BHE74_00009157 [Ensete ventricosum]|nr:hypothetical protein BHE74_00009157 [Ensete ventricosum]